MKNLKITKDYPGLVDVGWAYRLEGSLIVKGSLEVSLDKWLVVSEGIEAGGGIEV